MHNDPAPDISIVIPAYNESRRILPFLESLAGHCARSSRRYEVVVVDDGSRDGTVEVVNRFGRETFPIRLIRHGENRGKGAAVRTGMLAAAGARRAFMDADGSFDPADIEPGLAWLDRGFDVVIGSRFVPETGRPITETWHHRIMRAVLNTLTRVFLGIRVHDSQCGFKMFTAEAANALFAKSRMNDFSFDLEVLHLATAGGSKIKEVRVSCVAKPGSKVNIFHDTLKLFTSIFRIRSK